MRRLNRSAGAAFCNQNERRMHVCQELNTSGIYCASNPSRGYGLRGERDLEISKLTGKVSQLYSAFIIYRPDRRTTIRLTLE